EVGIPDAQGKRADPTQARPRFGGEERGLREGGADPRPHPDPGTRAESMKVEDLLGQSGEWLKGTGPESDVVISSRVRLARNLHRFPFLTVATPQIRAEVEPFVRQRLEDAKLPRKVMYWSLGELTSVDRTLLVERHLISK